MAPCPLGTTAWTVPMQVLSEALCMPWVVSNTSQGLGNIGVPTSELRWLFLPSSLLAMGTLALSPLLLVTILRNQRLRHQPHYLLLANILLADLAYILLHMLISSSLLGGWDLGRIACGILRDGVFTAYTSTILSFTATVLHAYLAITHPLHYFSSMSGKTARKTVALIWLVACFFPTILLWFGKQKNTSLEIQGTSCILPLGLGTKESRGHLVTITHICILCVLFVCGAIISYCFWRIYAEARPTGICTRSYSRARGTLIIHMVLITLYIGAGVVFSVDTILTKYHHIDTSTHTWLLAANSEVLTMLPRAMLPYLYTLRYRQLLGVVRGHFSTRRHGDIYTIFQSCQVHSVPPDQRLPLGEDTRAPPPRPQHPGSFPGRGLELLEPTGHRNRAGRRLLSQAAGEESPPLPAPVDVTTAGRGARGDRDKVCVGRGGWAWGAKSQDYEEAEAEAEPGSRTDAGRAQTKPSSRGPSGAAFPQQPHPDRRASPSPRPRESPARDWLRAGPAPAVALRRLNPRLSSLARPPRPSRRRVGAGASCFGRALGAGS
ncbi:putative G-protein coupled receptor 148 [Ctenodactylus gundi]